MKPRWIVHIDMDSFYVSVERLKNPGLIGRPIAVGGTGPRSVISSASYEARKFGVKSAMPTSQALRLCPQLVMVAPSFKDYSEISHRIFSQVKDLAPIFQKVSIDEAYLDLTGCERLYPSRIEMGQRIKQRVFDVSALNCSVGIGSNKMIAKIASDFCKPNNLLEVPVGEERAFLAPLSIEKIPGIGKKTAAILHSHAIMTCQDLAIKSDIWLRENLGDWGFEWRERAQGLHEGDVVEEWDRKSLGSEETFVKNVGDIEYLNKIILDLSEDIAFELRRENLMARTVHVKFRYPDFSTFSRALTLKDPTNLGEIIGHTASDLLKANKDQHRPLRLIGVRVTNLISADELEQQPIQLDLFSDVVPLNDDRRLKLEKAKDALKVKFGKKVFLSQIEKEK